MMKFRENEDAVSPVIGVILMVAITVILAAVIAAFVFGMGSNIETQKQVAINAKQITDGKLQVTVQSGADLSSLKYLRIEVTPNGGSSETFYAYTDKDSTIDKTVIVDGDTKGLDNAKGISVGSTYTMPAKLTDISDHIVIVGHFTDGREQMLLDTTL